MKKKMRIGVALLLLIVTTILLSLDTSPLREPTADFLTGEGSYGLPFVEGDVSYSQFFKPHYKELDTIGIAMEWPKEAQSAGYVEVAILDDVGTVLFTGQIMAEDMRSGVYSSLEVNRTLSHGSIYELRATSHLDTAMQANILVCSTDYKLSENKYLQGENRIDGAQLLTKYDYVNALRFNRFMQAFLCLLLAAAGIAFGLPENPWVRRVVAVVLLVLGPVILGKRLELLMPTQVLLPHAMKWNLALMVLFELCVLLVSQSARFTICFCNAFLTLLYCANYFVYIIRGSYLRVNELTAAGTAADVVGKYELNPTPDMAVVFCILAMLFCLGMCTGVNKEKRVVKLLHFGKVQIVIAHVVTAIMGIALFMGVGNYLLNTDFIMDHGFIFVTGLDQEQTYYYDGYLVGSLLSIKYSRVKEPVGYSYNRVQELVAQSKNLADETKTAVSDQPHIILIMDESFSDLRINGNLQLSKENLGNWNALKENTIRGYVNASVLGGGTANSEFEVFTGCAMAFLPDSYYAYEQAIKEPMNTMVSNLKNQGYTTYSMHPEKPSNWRRNMIYPFFGFENRFWYEDFAGAEKIHSGVSDAETFHKVEELYENRSENEKLFIFDLTMQNHGYYNKSNVERTVAATNVECDEANVYLSLVDETDRAFADLISYFEKEDEKVLICLFGDHQPKFMDANFYQDIYKQTYDGLSESERKRNLYKTPFVIWANYDIEEQADLDISMSYLGILLQQTAGVELTPFGKFLANQMQEYPVITVNGYVDAEGNYYNWEVDGTEFSDYRILQYNYLFDKQKVEEGF